ncbi:MAG: metallophosphoesterase [Raineya sp.]|jgi:Icc-related predicted phosphoesterase|nr:metallophosphoesterase [Raineya sp.]
MKILCISDTHGKHKKLDLPEADMIIHAGDISGKGDPWQIREFFEWFSALPYYHKIFIAGNHDFLAEKEPETFLKLIPENCIYLNDSGVKIEGFRIWGSPITPWFHDWAFNRHRGDEIAKHWELIPSDTDILITHGPPMGILDKTIWGKRVGCEELKKKVEQIRPKVHIFGHIHEDYGKLQIFDTTFINASSLNIDYLPLHKPIIHELNNSIS